MEDQELDVDPLESKIIIIKCEEPEDDDEDEDIESTEPVWIKKENCDNEVEGDNVDNSDDDEASQSSYSQSSKCLIRKRDRKARVPHLKAHFVGSEENLADGVGSDMSDDESQGQVESLLVEPDIQEGLNEEMSDTEDNGQKKRGKRGRPSKSVKTKQKRAAKPTKRIFKIGRTPHELLETINIIDGRKMYCCPHCEWKSPKVRMMQQHLSKHTGDKPLKCDRCPYQTRWYGAMSEHSRTHSGRIYSCGKCAYTSVSEKNFKAHALRHRQERLFECEQCLARFKTKQTLLQHHMVHTDRLEIERPFRCALCDKTFRCKPHLHSHMFVHTHREKSFKCELCEFRCTQHSYLVAHEKTHLSEKRFKCSECDYATHLNYMLQKHMTHHTGDKRYHCAYCPYRTAFNGHLTVHERIHSQDRPYKCNECSYSSRQSNHLKRHMMRHERDKPRPYLCSYCGANFCEEQQLSNHIIRRHKQLI